MSQHKQLVAKPARITAIWESKRADDVEQLVFDRLLLSVEGPEPLDRFAVELNPERAENLIRCLVKAGKSLFGQAFMQEYPDA